MRGLGASLFVAKNGRYEPQGIVESYPDFFEPVEEPTRSEEKVLISEEMVWEKAFKELVKTHIELISSLSKFDLKESSNG